MFRLRWVVAFLFILSTQSFAEMIQVSRSSKAFMYTDYLQYGDNHIIEGSFAGQEQTFTSQAGPVRVNDGSQSITQVSVNAMMNISEGIKFGILYLKDSMKGKGDLSNVDAGVDKVPMAAEGEASAYGVTAIAKISENVSFGLIYEFYEHSEKLEVSGVEQYSGSNSFSLLSSNLRFTFSENYSLDFFHSPTVGIREEIETAIPGQIMALFSKKTSSDRVSIGIINYRGAAADSDLRNSNSFLGSFEQKINEKFTVGGDAEYFQSSFDENKDLLTSNIEKIRVSLFGSASVNDHIDLSPRFTYVMAPKTTKATDEGDYSANGKATEFTLFLSCLI
jgi:hypothetical protein